jgi:plasmid maintenance system killer protein
VDVEYENKKLKASCTTNKGMQKAYSAIIGSALKRRIKELESAASIEDVLAGLGKWHSLTARGDCVYGGHLTANYRVIVQFRATGTHIVAWVLSVEDYHGKGA